MSSQLSKYSTPGVMLQQLPQGLPNRRDRDVAATLGSALRLIRWDGNWCHQPLSHGRPLSARAIVSLSFTDQTPGAAQVIFGTEPRLSSGAPRSTRTNEMKFSPWLQPQSSNQGSAGGACTTSEPYSGLLQQPAPAQNRTPLQLIMSLHCS